METEGAWLVAHPRSRRKGDQHGRWTAPAREAAGAIVFAAFALPLAMVLLGTIVFVPESLRLIEDIAAGRSIDARRVALLLTVPAGLVGLVGLRHLLMALLVGSPPRSRVRVAMEVGCGVVALAIVASLDHGWFWPAHAIVTCAVVAGLWWLAQRVTDRRTQSQRRD